MPQPLQTRADVHRAVVALRSLLPVCQRRPILRSQLARALDDFRSSFDSGPSPDGVSVDSNGRADLFGLRVLISSSDISDEGRDALANVVEALWDPDFTGSPWLEYDGPDSTNEQRRQSDAERRQHVSERPIRNVKDAIRRAIDSLQTQPEPPATRDSTTALPRSGSKQAEGEKPPANSEPVDVPFWRSRTEFGLRWKNREHHCDSSETRAFAVIQAMWPPKQGKQETVADVQKRVGSTATNNKWATNVASEANKILGKFKIPFSLSGNNKDGFLRWEEVSDGTS